MLPEPQHPGDREILARWARHQKIGWRILNTWLRPAPFLCPWRRRLGYAWRSVALLLLIGTAVCVVMEGMASTVSYSRSIAASWRQASGLPQLTLSPLDWKGRRVFADRFSASADNGTIRSIEISMISGSAPSRFGTSRSVWNLRDVEARSIAVVARPAPHDAGGGQTLAALSQHLNFRSLTVTHAYSLAWPEGNLRANEAVWRPGSDSSTLVLRATTLDTFPLIALPLETLQMTSDGEVWQIVGGNVARAQLPNDVGSAPVEIEGIVDSQGVGSLAVRAAPLDLSFLLPEDLRGLLSGSTDLDLLASFSPDAGHRASAQLVLHRIEIHGLAFFELLATLTGRPNLRNPNFASGIVTLERTQESTVILAPIRLIADNVITIEGSIVLRDGSIDATLGVGLPSAALDALPEWRGSVFRKGHGALYWREFEFQGLSVDEASATGCEQLSKLFAALRLSRKQQR